MSEPSTPMDFITSYLKKQPEAAYADVNKAAQAANFKIYPIMYGRAKSLLGLLPEGGSRARRARRKASGGEESRSRTLRQGRGPRVTDQAVNQISGFVERYRELEEERNRYRAALISVEKILRQTLDEK